MTLPEIIAGDMEPVLGRRLCEYVDAHLEEFKGVLADHPVKDNTGGISVCEAFWLYCLVKDLQPEMIVESGTLHGFSLYFLWKAAPSSEIHSFDPGCKPEIKLRDVEYHSCDWMDYFNSQPPRDSLVFFDDHQDQGERFEEACEHGVDHAVFHDNYLTLGHSHRPLRFCCLEHDVELCYTFECLRGDPIFTDVSVNSQTYRWLTWVQFGGKWSVTANRSPVHERL